MRALRSKRLVLQVTVAAAGVALLAAAPAVAEPPAISAKRAQAQGVLAQIRHLDSHVEKTIEAYNSASWRLERIRSDLRANTYQLKVARRNVRRAEQILVRHVVGLYERGGGDSTLEIILGARSLNDLIDRIDTAQRLSQEESRVTQEVAIFRARVASKQRQLVRSRAQQRRLVSRLARQRASIEHQLADRERLLSSIKSEIGRLQAEDRARQERLRRQAEARLAAQRAAAQRAAARAASAANSPARSDLGIVASTPEATVAPPSRYGGAVGIAMQYLGVPYRWGGASPSTGFDCSGFILYVYAKLGVSLPHHAAAQFGYGVYVSKDQLQPGDLVFFDGLGHNGMYIGGGQFIHAPHTGDVVKISSLSDSWYTAKWVGARRLL